MQIEITFTCQECELHNTLRTDTSNHGTLVLVGLTDVKNALVIDLACKCGHVSGELGLGYRFIREKHQPSIDR